MKREDTLLEVLRFGEAVEDHFYCLVDRSVRPEGLDTEKMKLTDPRNFDREFRQMGCLVMMTGTEIDELVRRGEVRQETLHADLFELCRREGIVE